MKARFAQSPLLARSACLALAVAFTAGALPAAAAPGDEEITVVAPYTIKRERSRSGVVEETVSVSRAVRTRDLDLRYDSDVRVLRDRIEIAARLACDEADSLLQYASYTSDAACVREAIRDAAPQTRALIQRARY
jgi:UrcA family protein